MRTNDNIRCFTVRIPKRDYDRIQEQIAAGVYMSVADFIRSAVRAMAMNEKECNQAEA